MPALLRARRLVAGGERPLMGGRGPRDHLPILPLLRDLHGFAPIIEHEVGAVRLAQNGTHIDRLLRRGQRCLELGPRGLDGDDWSIATDWMMAKATVITAAPAAAELAVAVPLRRFNGFRASFAVNASRAPFRLPSTGRTALRPRSAHAH